MDYQQHDKNKYLVTGDWSQSTFVESNRDKSRNGVPFQKVGFRLKKSHRCVIRNHKQKWEEITVQCNIVFTP